ncbi:MAG: ABC transporter permease [Gemmatimonadaceae bacterium]|jgi:peptide/nickel transport system permease protein|nr:ABC transporter permease [Gemmatimonadaceae bacterium]
MWSFARRRLVDALLVTWTVGTLVFVLLHLAPGDPVTAVLTNPRVSPAVRAQQRAMYGLDRPIGEQYLRHLRALGRGELGYSFSRQRPVRAVLMETVPYSMLLIGGALGAAVLLGVVIGAWQAVHAERRRDVLTSAVTAGIGAVPEVWLATLLQGALAMELTLFPLAGACAPRSCGTLTGWRAALDVAHHAALPVLTLALLFGALLSRLQRAALRAVLIDPAVGAARAKGATPRRVLFRHALPRALRPTLTAVALSLPALVGGAVFVEAVFAWPGMGSVMVQAIAVRDYPLVTAVAMVGSLLVVVGTTCAELATAWLDPRLASTA